MKGDVLMSLPYGFMSSPNGLIIVDPEKVSIVRTIYQQYLSGISLGGIADFLFEHGIPSPKGRERWTQPVLSNLLSNQKYIGYIVSFDDFFLAQGEKSKRSNIDEDTNKRKATRYNSQSVLSGLLVCAECSHNYRRITRPSGEIVWRCASRVEHGKKFCKHSPSISEERIKEIICERLDMRAFDESRVKDQIDTILIHSDSSLQIKLQNAKYFELLPN